MIRDSKFSAKFRIRTAFVVSIILLIAIAISTVGYISFLNAKAAVDDLSLQLRKELTDRTNRQMQSYMDNTFAVNDINASSFQIGELIPLAIAVLYSSFIKFDISLSSVVFTVGSRVLVDLYL